MSKKPQTVYFPLTIMSNYKGRISAAKLHGKSLISHFPAYQAYYGLAAIAPETGSNLPIGVFSKTYDPSKSSLAKNIMTDISNEIIKPYGDRHPIIVLWTSGLDESTWCHRTNFIDYLKTILGAGPILDDLNQKAFYLSGCIGDVCYCLVVALDDKGKVKMSPNEAADSGMAASCGLSLSLVSLEVDDKTIYEIREFD